MLRVVKGHLKHIRLLPVVMIETEKADAQLWGQASAGFGMLRLKIPGGGVCDDASRRQVRLMVWGSEAVDYAELFVGGNA